VKNIHVELLLGLRVRDINDRVVGRIMEIRADSSGVVKDYEIGAAALLKRLGMTSRRLIGLSVSEPKRIPWQLMDLRDPEKPRITCAEAELPK
jgi:hypothetical protein